MGIEMRLKKTVDGTPFILANVTFIPTGVPVLRYVRVSIYNRPTLWSCFSHRKVSAIEL